MIPQRVHLAILGTTILLIVVFLFALFSPISAGATPRPCVGAVVRTIEGVEIVRQSNRKLCPRPAAGHPSRQAVQS